MKHCELYLDEVSRIAMSIDSDVVEHLAVALADLRKRGAGCDT